MIPWLFGLVIVVGATFAINGAIIIATGRQNRLFTIASLGLAALRHRRGRDDPDLGP